LENTPQQVCQLNGGYWVEGQLDTISSCQLVCCRIGDQAAFVTQTRCIYFSGLYGIETTFEDTPDEFTCLESANLQERGACVVDDGFPRTCTMETRENCQEIRGGYGSDVNVEFHPGLLCSAPSLETNCGMPTNPRTTCVDGKDEVYFLDTCGNLANIYDSTKIGNTAVAQAYWTTIKTKEESCNPSSSNANSAACGNCDYLLGSICKAYNSRDPQTPRQPAKGEFVCSDLSCRYDSNGNGGIDPGETYKHGETWCATNSPGLSKSLTGSEGYRLSCFNGDVTIEQCDSFRQKVCIQNNIQTAEGIFRNAICRANLWRDCYTIDNEAECEDEQERDCKWLIGESMLGDEEGNALVLNSAGTELITGTGQGAACVPKYPPGFDFWNAEGDIQTTCAMATQSCVVKFERHYDPLRFKLTPWNCEENCECIGLRKDDNLGSNINKIYEWIKERTTLCYSLGDCGNKTNYLGMSSYQGNRAFTQTTVED